MATDPDLSPISACEDDAKPCMEDDLGVNARDSDGRTRLLRAVISNRYKTVYRLLDREGADPYIKDNKGHTALWYAVKSGRSRVVNKLLSHGGASGLHNNEKGTLLSTAVELGHSAVLEVLLKYGLFSPDLYDSIGQTLLFYAIENGFEEAVQVLLDTCKLGLKIKDEGAQTLLSKAVEHKQVGVVKLLLDSIQLDLAARDCMGQSVLSQIAKRGHVEILKLILDKKGSDLDARDNMGRSALSHAVEHGFFDITKLLLGHDDSGVNSKDDSGRTPLSWMAEDESAWNTYPSMLNLLLEKGATLDSRDKDGRTPLSRAAGCGTIVAIEQLLTHRVVDPNSTDGQNRTPLWWAAEGGHAAAIKLLLAKENIDPNICDDNSHTPLAHALLGGHAVVPKLVARDKVTLHTSVQTGDPSLVKMLIEAEYDLNKRDLLSRTPLHVAALFGHIQIAEMLVNSLANLNAKDANGATPLQLALQRKHESIVDLLLEHDANTLGTISEDWFRLYNESFPGGLVELSHTSCGKKEVRLIHRRRVEMSIPAAFGRRILLFSKYASWWNRMALDDKYIWISNKSRIEYHIEPGENCIKIFIAGCFPIGRDRVNQKQLLPSGWGKRGIAWTIVPPSSPKDGSNWKSVDHFSTLPFGWIPENGADFFASFVQTLKEEWLKFCTLAEEHLSKRRLDQLHARGNQPEMIHCLAQDAQEWAILRTVLRDQVRMARQFAEEYFRSYDQNNGSGVMQLSIDSFSSEISDQISQLEQTVKDLLQFEFAWVSINEAYRSTSIAKSIKRLSWITFIFLPAMFASSLFGMNVNILSSNPDWRWYLVFGFGFLFLTCLGWLLFKYGQVEIWIERHVGTRLNRWSGTKMDSF